MSKITSPILLDSTGQETNRILSQISDSLLAANTLIDDTATGPNRVWSSSKIVKAFTSEETTEGANVVYVTAVGGTPLDIETKVVDAPANVVLEINSTTGKSDTWTYLVPVNGTYNWSTGKLIMEDGTEVQLVSHFIPAFDGTTTIAASGVKSIKVTYKTISKQSGGSADFEIISGGSAKEEA